MKLKILLICCLSLAWACGRKTDKAGVNESTPKSTPVMVADLISAPHKFDGKTVRAKGLWQESAEGDALSLSSDFQVGNMILIKYENLREEALPKLGSDGSRSYMRGKPVEVDATFHARGYGEDNSFLRDTPFLSVRKVVPSKED